MLFFVIYRLLLIGLFTLLFASSHTFAQKYNIKRYSVNEGLPSGNVYDVHTDEFGNMWFATAYGLVKHDGSDYYTYGTQQGLKDEMVYDMHFDEEGYIWVSSEIGGVARFDQFHFEYIPELAFLDTMVVNFITSQNESDLWFGTNENGVFVWDRETNQIDSISTDQGLPHYQIWDIYFNEEGVWISTMFGVALYSREEGRVLKSFTQEDGIAGEYIYQVVETSDGRKWIPTSSGVSIINTDDSIENITELNGIELGFVFNLAVDDKDQVWIGAERQGLFIYKNGTAEHIKKENGLSSNFVYRLVKDDDGTIWIATDGDGVSVFKDANFKLFDKNSELGVVSVYSSKIASDGVIWLGTDRGLSKLENGNFSNYEIPSPFYEDDEIWAIEELPNGNLLLLTYTYDLLEFDGNTFMRPDFSSLVEDYYINDILVQEDGTIFFSSFGALARLSGGEVEEFLPPDDRYWQLSLGSMYQDSRGMLWIATEGGVARFSNNEFEYYTAEHGVTGNNIHTITEDQSSNLWVGSNAGISVLNSEHISDNQLIFEDFYNQELFTGETVFLKFDGYGNLWQGTNAGINYLNLDGWGTPDYTFKQIHFSLSTDGKGIEFNGAAHELSEDGTLWFGTNSEGLVSFNFTDERSEVEYEESPLVFLRSITSNNVKIFDQIDSDMSSPISIEYENNDLTFRINAIDYKNPQNISIQYLLEGFDNEWRTDTNIDEIRYTNLPAGEYVLRVMAKSPKSEWGEPSTLIGFKVNKPFYLTYGFFGLSLILLVGVIYAFVNSRISRLEKAELQKLVEKRTKDLETALGEKEVLIKEIHHRVKNNLAVISGLLELQGFRIPQGPAKQALVESRMRVIAMSKIHENLYQNYDLANVNFRKFINDLIRSIQTTFNQFDKNIEVIQYIDELHINVNQGVPIGLITNELVSNCYKHAFNGKEEGTITISFSEDDQDYVLEVKDNGVGSETNLLEIRKKSLGMSLIKSLASQLKGDITYDGEEGSHFTLIIPKNVSIDF